MIGERVSEIRRRVERAAGASGRNPASVRVVAAAKGAGAQAIKEAVAAGIADVGENRAQELRSHYAEIGDAVTWHFLGGVQTNKVRYLDAVRLLHSVDRPEEAEALQRRGEATDRTWDVLIEVNVAGESTKQGIPAEAVDAFCERLGSWPRVRARGFMVMAPVAPDPEDVRWVFAEARRLRDRLRDADAGLEELSMGMSDDFEVAVEEGATLVRIGRAIFSGV